MIFIKMTLLLSRVIDMCIYYWFKNVNNEFSFYKRARIDIINDLEDKQ